MRSEKFELFSPRRRGAPICEIDDFALRLSFDRGVRFFDKTFQAVREPMIASRGSAFAVHALLHDDPFAVIGNDKAVQVKLETILHGGAVDLGDKPACGREAVTIKADALADGAQFIRRAARMFAAAAAHMQAKFAFERAEHARGDARGVPIHPHDGAKRLKPEGMRQPSQEFFAPVMMDDGLRDDRAKPRHSLGQPFRHLAVVQRQVGASGASHLSWYSRTWRLSASFLFRSGSSRCQRRYARAMRPVHGRASLLREIALRGRRKVGAARSRSDKSVMAYADAVVGSDRSVCRT